MRLVVIESSLDKKIDLIVQIAKELGLSVREQKEITISNIAWGIGRIATDAELEAYLNSPKEIPLSLDKAFQAYES